jgi:hypothetical protein
MALFLLRDSVRFRIAGELILGERLDAEPRVVANDRERGLVTDGSLDRLAHEGGFRLLRSCAGLEPIERGAGLAARHLRVVVNDQIRTHEQVAAHPDRIDEVHSGPLLVGRHVGAARRGCSHRKNCDEEHDTGENSYVHLTLLFHVPL